MITRLCSFKISALCTALTVTTLAGCSTTLKMTSNELTALGVRDGGDLYAAQTGLAQKGYFCYVGGALRENFDCSIMKGVFPTCVLHVRFRVDDQNLITHVRAADPACIGTP